MPPSPPEQDSLRPLLGAMLGSILSIDALPSGTGGKSYLVETRSGRFAAKAFADGSAALLGPSEQFALLRVLADAGIAPEPVGVDAAAGLLVTAFVEGTAITPAALRRPRPARTVARALRRLHAVPFTLPPFSPAAYASRYLEAIGGRDRLARRDLRRLDELHELAGLPLSGPSCVCHNDLAADNLLFDGSVRLIDFDYAVTSTPVLDLASLAVMNGLTETEASAVLESYYDGEAPFSRGEFARVQRLVRLLAHFWSLASPEDAAATVARYRIGND